MKPKGKIRYILCNLSKGKVILSIKRKMKIFNKNQPYILSRCIKANLSGLGSESVNALNICLATIMIIMRIEGKDINAIFILKKSPIVEIEK
jgi:hypothetical protein